MQLLIKVPEETDMEKLPDELLTQIKAVRGKITKKLLWI